MRQIWKRDTRIKPKKINKIRYLKIILFILILQPITSYLIISSLGLSSPVILIDNFVQKENTWYFRTDGVGTSSNQVENGYLNLTINEKSTNTSYSNAEIYNNSTDPRPYHLNYAKVRLRNTALVNGSRGWGFWNGQMDSTQSEIAWFTYIAGNDTYQQTYPQGLYATTQTIGTSINMTLISNVTLLEWHNYTIDWTSSYVKFYIDEKLVCTRTQDIPSGNMRFDVWVDNAVYVLSGNQYVHYYHNIDNNSSVLVDWIKIYEYPYIVANFSVSQTSGTVPLSVEFNASISSSDWPVEVEWDFGDGTIGFGKSVVHEYSSAGIYSVNLTIKTELGNTTSIYKENIINATTSTSNNENNNNEDNNNETENKIGGFNVMILSIILLASVLALTISIYKQLYWHKTRK
ncbi:MAG: PKD domain-containing protein [Promethearchaeota archaeon]